MLSEVFRHLETICTHMLHEISYMLYKTSWNFIARFIVNLKIRIGNIYIYKDAYYELHFARPTDLTDQYHAKDQVWQIRSFIEHIFALIRGVPRALPERDTFQNVTHSRRWLFLTRADIHYTEKHFSFSPPCVHEYLCPRRQKNRANNRAKWGPTNAKKRHRRL